MASCGVIGRNCVTNHMPSKFAKIVSQRLIGGNCRSRYLLGEAVAETRPLDAERFARNVATKTCPRPPASNSIEVSPCRLSRSRQNRERTKPR